MYSRAAIVYFHNPYPCKDEHYRSQWEFWKKICVWSDEVDKLYIIDDNGHNFNNEDNIWLSEHFKSFQIIRTSDFPWNHDNIFLFRIKEDLILRIDQDTFIYQKGLIDNYFKMMEEGYDFVSSFRIIGNQSQTTNKFILAYWNKFPFLKEQWLYEMGEWFWFIKRNLLHECTDIDFGQSFVKSFSSPIPIGTYIPELDYFVDEHMVYEHGGLAGVKILSKSKKPFCFPTDYTRQKIDSEQQHDENLGWYHIGEWKQALALVQITSEEYYFDNFLHTPDRIEIFRPLAWLWIMDEATGNLPKYENNIMKLVHDKGYGLDEWLKYIEKVKNCHKWIKNFI